LIIFGKIGKIPKVSNLQKVSSLEKVSKKPKAVSRIAQIFTKVSRFQKVSCSFFKTFQKTCHPFASMFQGARFETFNWPIRHSDNFRELELCVAQTQLSLRFLNYFVINLDLLISNLLWAIARCFNQNLFNWTVGGFSAAVKTTVDKNMEFSIFNIN